jgi:hypothetical protein
MDRPNSRLVLLWGGYGIRIYQYIHLPCRVSHLPSEKADKLTSSAYRPVAASALASNSFLRSAFAAGFPLYVPCVNAPWYEG